MCFACGVLESSSFFHYAADADEVESERTVANHTALFAGASWVDEFDVLTVRAQPAFVTFSFPTRTPEQVRDNFGGVAATWTRFTEADKALARQALKQWADASGLKFLEVEGDKGDIQFNWMNFNRVAGSKDALAFAYYPNGQPRPDSTVVERFSDLSGDVFLNAAERSDGLAGQDRRLFVLLHEIGHALGLKHPFEASTANPNVLADKLDDQSNTVMSYTGDEDPKLGLLDRAAIRALYGTPSSDGSHLSSWKWSRTTETLVQVGKSGADQIYGVSVRDEIIGQAGSDTISGLAGNDFLSGGTGIDTLFGGDGDDRLMPGSGLGSVDGGAGTDVLDLSDLRGLIRVEDGVHDRIWIGKRGGGADVHVSGVEVFIGTDRDDIFKGHGGDGMGETDHTFIGAAGDDRFSVGCGDDFIDGGDGFDTVDFSEKDGAITINLALTTPQPSHQGSDTLISIEGVIGSDGNDRLIASKTSSILDGFMGSDILIGNVGDDHLDGSWESDTIRGGGGDDIIIGGSHSDTLSGGAGVDTFVLETVVADGGEDDHIVDFEERDQIHLIRSAYLTLPVGRLSVDAFCIGPSPADANDRVIYDPATGALSIFLVRTVVPQMLQVAQLDRGLDLSASDFLIV